MPLTEAEYLLACLAEECVEVSEACARVTVRVTKALRFGATEVQPGQGATNVDRIVAELADLKGVVAMLEDAGIITPAAVAAKRLKVEAFLEYARRIGAVEGRGLAALDLDFKPERGGADAAL